MAPELHLAPLMEMGQQQDKPNTCPICGATVEHQRVGQNMGWSCVLGGFAHYYQARYGYLKQWFTSGQGNLREPVISAMNCVQTDYAA